MRTFCIFYFLTRFIMRLLVMVLNWVPEQSQKNVPPLVSSPALSLCNEKQKQRQLGGQLLSFTSQ